MSNDGIRFDWYSPIEDEFIETLAVKVVDHIKLYKNSRGLTKSDAEKRDIQWLIISRHILSALYFAYFVVSKRKNRTPVSVVRSSGRHSENAKDANKVPYSWRYADAVYKAIRSLSWIEEKKGIENKGYTRIYAVKELAYMFDQVGLKWMKQYPKPKDQLIVLRDRQLLKPRHPSAPKKYKKVLLETPSTLETEAMAGKLFSYNTFLLKQCIALDLPDNSLWEIAKYTTKETAGLDEQVNYLDFSRVQLRRIFARGSLEKGGRFYNGFWQSIPSKFRPHITINGYKTCEVDFSTMSLRIVYAQRGIEVDPDVDLYDIGVNSWKGSKDVRRPLIKKYINALMNDEEGNYKLSKNDLKDLNLSQKDFKDMVLNRHKGIAEDLIAGVGLGTQLIDSQIAELVMHDMMFDNVLVLPIHDSFIVREGFQPWLKESMLEAFKVITGSSASLKTDRSKRKDHFNLSEEEINISLKKENKDPYSNVINLSLMKEAFLESFKNDNLMYKYLQSWEELR